MTDRQKLLNASDKTNSDFRASQLGSAGRVLPDGPSAYNDNRISEFRETESKMAAKKRKRCIIIVLVITLVLIGGIIGIVVAVQGDSDDPPSPPSPVSGGVNPYYLIDDGTYKVGKNKISGLIGADQSTLSALKKTNKFQSLIQGDQQPIGLLDPLGIPTGLNNPLIEKLYFEVGQAEDLVSYIHIDDANNTRYSPGEDVLKKPGFGQNRRIDECGLQLSTDPFSFSFTDTRNNSNVLLHTKDQNFYMTDKYIQLDMQLPSQRIYGLGERNRGFDLGEGTWTMWANGQESPYDDGTGGKQTHGVHPFALVQTAIPGQFFGIFFRNANAMSPVIKHNDDGGSTLSYITTGGALDIYFFWKGNAKQIITRYQSTFGKPSMPPMWALGWHSASRYCKTQSDYEAMIGQYSEIGMPLEAVWIYQPYTDQNHDFKIDTASFPNLTDFKNTLNQNNQSLGLSVYPGLNAYNQNPYYIDAQEDFLLIKSSINLDNEYQGALVTDAQTQHTVFLDMFNDKSAKLWEKGLKDLYGQVEFDALWFDKNEATAECNGECPKGKQIDSNTTQESKRFLSESSDDDNSFWYQSYNDQANISTYDLPFIPGKTWNLDNMTMSLNATHPESKYSEYDVHSLFGHMQAKRTKEFLDGDSSVIPGKRSFTLSRSTFAGSGAHTQHWQGDNFRTWSNMTYSISSIMNFNMFGIPVTGPDTCGTYGNNTDETEELCARWIQLSSFYPFSRSNQDDVGGGTQFGPQLMSPTHQAWIKNAIQQKLTFARQFYTCLYEASVDGGSCFDPMLFHFPTDEETFSNIEHSFIFANALKITPILDYNTSTSDTVKSYFPKGSWVNMNNYSDIVVSEGGADGWKDLANDQSENSMINSHLMPGGMVIKQEGKFMTTKELTLQDSPMTLISNRDVNGAAYGKVYIDDGVSSNSKQARYEFLLAKNSIKKWQVEDQDDDELQSWSMAQEFVITNAEDLNNTDFACTTSLTSNSIDYLQAVYSDENKTLTLKNPGGLIGLHNLKDIYFGYSMELNSNYALCQNQGMNYGVVGGGWPDLSGPQVSFQLENTILPMAKPTLNMTLSVLKTGVINIYYTFADESLYEKPFEVPTSMVNPKRDEISEDAKLSDYLQINNPDHFFSIAFIYKGAMFHRIDDILLLPHVNNLDTTSWTHSGDGVDILRIFGLFERTADQLVLDGGAYSQWAKDIPNPQESPFPEPNLGKNTYGTHPFYWGKGPSTEYWYGIYLNNAAATDYWLDVDTESEANQKTVVKSRSSGGVGDIYIILGDDDTAESMIKNYQKHVVGLPVVIPQWALGWNQCRWGYENTTELEWSVGNYSKYDLPLDAQWADIDYMHNYRDFEVDPVNFDKLGEFVDDLHSKNMKFVPIIDAGISQRDNGEYEAYMDGKDKDIFLKNDAGEILTSRVWPNDAVFPDWFNDNTTSWWHSWLTKLYNQVKFDGLWLDMNEASNFCQGTCVDSQKSDSPLLHQIPYIPTGSNIETKSISLDATHANGVKELDAHSLFGSMEVKATHEWFQAQEKRTMIIERSAFSGMGKFGSRWLGDNFSTEEYMANSVTSIMAHNILGIPLVGADICGFNGNTTAELCARWYMLGSFYPFSRNHNSWDSVRQEPYEFANDIYHGTTTYLDIIRIAMRNKYSLLRYMYSEMSMLSREGGMFFKPLYMSPQFQDNHDGAYDYPELEKNFLLGDALQIGISHTLGQNSTEFFLPDDHHYCDLLSPKDPCIFTGNRKIAFDSYAYNAYCWLISGHIIPFQDAQKLHSNTTVQLQHEPIDILINPQCDGDGNCHANGRYLNDDGVLLNTTGNQNLFVFNYTGPQAADTLTLSIDYQVKAINHQDNIVNTNDILASLQILNAKSMFDEAATYNVESMNGSVTLEGTATYDSTTDRLVWNAPEDKVFALPVIGDTITFTKAS